MIVTKMKITNVPKHENYEDRKFDENVSISKYRVGWTQRAETKTRLWSPRLGGLDYIIWFASKKFRANFLQNCPLAQNPAKYIVFIENDSTTISFAAFPTGT